jgi:hypothetical protein
MKTAYILLAALFVSFTPCRAQDVSPLRFEATEWNFGDIQEEGGTVSHVFEFTNSSSTPVSIDRVVASCGCTTPEYPRNPVASGGKARIEVTFDPRGMPGEFVKTVSVLSGGGGKNRDLLTIQGNVIPRPLTIEEEFPHDMGGGLRVSTDKLTFRTVPQGRSVEMTVDYINTSTETITLAFESVEQSGLLSVVAPEAVCDGCRGTIAFTYDLTETTTYGAVFDVVKPVVNGTHSTEIISSTMTGVDDFSEVDVNLAPRFFLDASYHDFGEVRRRSMPYVFRLTASNEGSEELHIRSVSQTEGLKSTLRGGMTIAPGAELPFEVIFNSGKYSSGEVMESIRLVVDDPMRPAREIRIAAIIKE